MSKVSHEVLETHSSWFSMHVGLLDHGIFWKCSGSPVA